MPAIVCSPAAPSRMLKAAISNESSVLEKVGSVRVEKSSCRREMSSPRGTVEIAAPVGCRDQSALGHPTPSSPLETRPPLCPECRSDDDVKIGEQSSQRPVVLRVVLTVEGDYLGLPDPAKIHHGRDFLTASVVDLTSRPISSIPSMAFGKSPSRPPLTSPAPPRSPISRARRSDARDLSR
ncbi:hypothetical protein TIFTF001_017513 [Ficus carica]|uniref:Uncharacterized protein n=1 Tax=Ficus carica TaxID=3494 RepID=A0AA88ACD0_FICCA|nr:hypothetical protein TIFTF001_017513 [Ficus carica]